MTDDDAAEIAKRIRAHSSDMDRRMREQSESAAKDFRDFTTAYLDRITAGDKPAAGDTPKPPEEFREGSHA